MSDLPRKAVTRTAKLAALPLGFAGRATWGLGKRIGGKSAELVAREVQQRTADQLFKTLGELKGGAMKLGQALSVFESALPEEVAGPYRAALTKLQEARRRCPRVRSTGFSPNASGRTGGSISWSSRTHRRLPPRSGRCTGRCGTTAARSL